ncbi:glycosyltransferase family 2 protein [Enterococcus lactis]|uniref:glycosyltransferase family 2 protein n=1 Tax=Enterococcus TaxID=1350 RepID=UPI00064CA733|nr:MULTISPECIES: glycosyltransferase family 2 protein [Enterococcus]EME3557566.1 glycosyltransferase family 2 protein [Enterococcus faecium]EME7169715.1 glycosyltransferase family 2 protein [Enterococcus faecium]MBS6011397.1 glycosyltransferase family 2 protein [Enterococcus faecium]MDT2777891.1 glycosyltransferase family 2 protein [Enterococcus lactis]NTK39357.1 glycosyltransferase family 2 protein [Enterococcus faecium]
MSKIETSIIIPCYNVEDYIASVVNNLQEQTYQNFEVIFINDGSTDRTKDQIETRINNLTNYSIYTTKNRGAANARNLGIKKAVGEYIYFFDADDKIDPFLLEKVLRQIKTDGADMLIFGYYAKNTKGRIVYQGSYRDKEFLNSNETFFSFINAHFYENNLLSPWNKLYRRQFLKEKGLYFPPVSSSEDALFNLELFNHVQKVSISDEILYEYTVGRKGSLQNDQSNKKFKEDYEVCVKLKKLASKKNLDESIYYSYLINIIYKYFNKDLVSLINERTELREIVEKKVMVNLSPKTKIKLYILKMKWKCYK